jgi:glycosyltransferase 2 family protein
MSDLAMRDRTATRKGPRARNEQPAQTDAAAPGGWKRWLKPVLAIVVIALAAFLLHRTLSKYSYDEIVGSLTAIPGWRFGLALLSAAGSYLCLTGFDWLATRYIGKRLSYPYVALTSFCSLSLGHNIGFAALSSGAVRYRFYSRVGIGVGDIARIIVFCGITVGLGLLILGGLATLIRSGLAAEITGLGRAAVIGLGLGCLAAAAGYVAVAAFVRRPLKIRNWTFEPPPVPLALGQCLVGTLNFACVSACLYNCLAALGDVSYLAVATVYVMAIVASLITHVPGGLGVIETVVLHLLPGAQVIGALVAFRVIYFLIPLCIGGPLFGLTELWARRRGASARA